MPDFKLRFAEDDINYWAERYSFIPEDDPVSAGRYARENSLLNVDHLYKICHWKSKRRSDLARENSEITVAEITRFSFDSEDEYSRISSLTLLKGVRWPTASVILHFCVDDNYPILDERAIWSLGEIKPAYYDFDYWWMYVEKCREISNRNSISIRQLDKALWQYSKANQ